MRMLVSVTIQPVIPFCMRPQQNCTVTQTHAYLHFTEQIFLFIIYGQEEEIQLNITVFGENKPSL